MILDQQNLMFEKYVQIQTKIWFKKFKFAKHKANVALTNSIWTVDTKVRWSYKPNLKYPNWGRNYQGY